MIFICDHVRIMDTTVGLLQAVYLESGEAAGGRFPQLNLGKLSEFSCIIKAPIKDGQERVSINSKVDLDPGGTDRDGDSSQQTLNVTVIRMMHSGGIATHQFIYLSLSGRWMDGRTDG